MIESCMTTTSDAAIHELLHTRWSPRIFDTQHTLSDADLGSILEAARWSPSCANTQPWAFVVSRRGDEAHAAIVDSLAPGNAIWAPGASALIVAIRREIGDEGNPLPYAAYDLGQAVAHLSIQAQALGLVTHQFAGFDHGQVAAHFGVPEGWVVTAGIAVGRVPDAETWAAADAELQERERQPRTRKDLAEFVFSDRFGHSHPVVTAD